MINSTKLNELCNKQTVQATLIKELQESKLATHPSDNSLATNITPTNTADGFIQVNTQMINQNNIQEYKINTVTRKVPSMAPALAHFAMAVACTKDIPFNLTQKIHIII